MNFSFFFFLVWRQLKKKGPKCSHWPIKIKNFYSHLGKFMTMKVLVSHLVLCNRTIRQFHSNIIIFDSFSFFKINNNKVVNLYTWWKEGSIWLVFKLFRMMFQFFILNNKKKSMRSNIYSIYIHSFSFFLTSVKNFFGCTGYFYFSALRCFPDGNSCHLRIEVLF